MKKNIFYPIIGCLMLLSAGCSDDILDKAMPGSLSTDIFFESEDDAFQSLIAAYSEIKSYPFTYSMWAFGDVLSDDAIFSGSDDDVASFARMESFDYPADNVRILNRFLYGFRGINKACQAYDGISKMDDTSFSKHNKNALLGEARFLRALYYHELVKCFGDLPLINQTPTIADKNKPLSPEKEIYAQIEDDLTEAVKYLPKRSQVNYVEYAGRATQGAAYALLSRVYLFDEKYDGAKTAALEVINSGEYRLTNTYGEQFTLAGEHGPESIFEINHYDSPTQSAAATNNGNCHVLIMLPFGVTYGYGMNQPRQDLADAFDEIGDTQRKEATLLTEQDLEMWESPTDFAKLGRNRTGYYNQKYYLPPSERSKEIRNNPLNIKMIRLAEVYLNYAEACVKSSIPDEGEAKKYLGKLRERVGLSHITSTGEQLFTDIIKERRLELAMEGFRFWDVVRVGLAPELFKVKGNFEAGKDEHLPLPQDERDRNNW
jgi:hypothetical protein